MKFILLTLFPEMFVGPFDHSIVKRAQQKGLLTIEFVNLRDFSTDSYKSVDDHPYGGEKGMILRVDIVDHALEAIHSKIKQPPYVILLDPRGETFTEQTAKKLLPHEVVVLICGRYEGVDERVRSLVNHTISIGDYVVTGGELPAMIIIDSVSRLIPGVLPKADAFQDESFMEGLLEYPQYTRPETYKGMRVPEVLRSGNHETIKQWRKTKAQEITKKYRPDLLNNDRGQDC